MNNHHDYPFYTSSELDTSAKQLAHNMCARQYICVFDDNTPSK